MVENLNTTPKGSETLSGFVTHKNTQIRYRTSGKGGAVVLLHGFLEDLTMWDDITEVLSKRNRIVSIDLLGHGKTGNLGYVHTMSAQAEMVKAVLNHLKLRKYILIGHSMGGYVSLAFAELFKDSIKGICLMNSTPVSDTKEKKINRDRAVVAVKQNHKMFIRMSITNLFSEENRTIFKKEIECLINDGLKLSVQGIVASLEGMKIRKNRKALFRKATFKKMLILGKNDPVLDAQSLRDQTKNSDIKVVEFPDGHMSHIENKKELIKTLQDFVKKPLPSPPRKGEGV
ncbi:alpha/beta hydrolase [Aureibaculum sp. 2210JD6-5]|uniref:alpha/beta fold hydrolase n=1 Tax=Aureibaculum sp. 2210JD6-5 TaxID=3103957 RepID=UPI002AAE0D53|nr:alpha/beta hydrolase [Aureibaculum sp. 2210JD6-5]MDY7394840.1 alpha/beta hydrolase [Aureibaculum sp. 2210JD6-5]